MTNHHLLLASFLPATRISRKHDGTPEGMVISPIGLLASCVFDEIALNKLMNQSRDQ